MARRLPVGKLPPDLLERLLASAPVRDPRVVVGPALGADATLLDFGDRYLVAKADPITFATDWIGWYAVQVNANDVACLGARPRWFLATLLLPEGAGPALAEEVFRQVAEACRSLGVDLVGGHTEVTYGLTRPILAGAMLGEVEKGREVRPGAVRPGDRLLLARGVALEGTALLAREAGEALRRRGLDEATLDRARRLLFDPGISVVEPALTATATGRVHALHDPTEGGLLAGAWEMARASGLGLEVEAEAVPVLPETQAVCRALGLDPLALLASGALLLAVPPEGEAEVRSALQARGIPAVPIGRFLPPAEGVRLRTAGGLRPLHPPERDEVARALEALETP